VTYGVALAPDGEVLLVGNGAHAEYLTRFNPDGSLDTAFGNATPGNTYVPGGQRLAVGTGDIFVGNTFASTAAPYDDFEIRAYTPGGGVDAAFGNGGRVQTDVNGASKDELVALGLQPDGKLVALGQTEAQPAAFPFRVAVSGLARYLTSAGQPPSNQTPFNGTPLNLPGTLEFENFDNGGEGVAYHDTERANLGAAAYRPTEGVDIEPTTDTGGGYNVGFTKAGEWLEYAITNPAATDALVGLDVRLASLRAGGRFHLEIDGKTVASFTAPATGSWQTYATLSTPKNIRLAHGHHTLRLVMDQNNSTGYVANFNWMKLVGY
jgi:hypothetical protein